MKTVYSAPKADFLRPATSEDILQDSNEIPRFDEYGGEVPV